MPARKDPSERKDRVVQTRVNQELDDALKAEAARRRLPVSQLIRHVLEDAVHLVGNVVDNVDAIAQDAIGLGRQASTDATRLARRAATHYGARGRAAPSAARAEDAAAPPPAPDPEPDAEPTVPDFKDIYAWQSLHVNRNERCALGGETLERGDEAYLGLSDLAGPRRWLCPDCHARLSE